VNPKKFSAELKRRKVYSVAVAYVIAGWAIAEGISQVFPVFDIPNSVVRVIVLLIVLGFPVALVLAWFFDLTRYGIVRTPNVDVAGKFSIFINRQLRRFLAHIERMKLKPQATSLVGGWVTENGQLRADATCARISWLTSHHLRKIAISMKWSAWETSFPRPDDRRYWEQTYARGEMPGGGPPALNCLTREQAKAKYGDAVP